MTVSRPSFLHRSCIPALALLAFAFASSPALLAQSSAAADFSSSQPSVAAQDDPSQTPTLPQAPTPQAGSTQYPPQPADQSGRQTSRILGILPNFRAISANQHLPPQTIKEKFTTATEDSFDYSALPVPLFVAYLNFERGNVPEFGTGGAAFGRYVWHSVTDQTQENYFVEFIVPAVTHEDTRYYTKGCCGFPKRSVYALEHIFITRTDSGKNTVNLGEIIGAGASAGVSNLYYPRAYRSLSNTGDQWALDLGLDAFGFFVKEFWPEVNRTLFHDKYATTANQK